MAVNRREFLASAAVTPLLAGLRTTPAYAAETPHRAPYLELTKYITPGADEFTNEAQAADLLKALREAMRAGQLPASTIIRGHSPCAKKFAAVGAGVQKAIFDSADTDVEGGWRRWLASLGEVRRSDFYALPDDVVRFEVASRKADGQLAYRTGHWRLRWEGSRISEFTPIEEHVTIAERPWFRDVTTHTFSRVPSFRKQLAKGVPYWRARLDPATGIDIYGSNGVAVGDIDGDGVDEVYVCQPGGLPNRLYKFAGDGTLVDITDHWGTGLLDDTSSALFIDLRNSGRQDLVVLRSAGPLLLINDGQRFRLRADAFRFATQPAGNFTGCAAADYDRDGKLDLYLCCYVYFQSEAQYTYASPYHDAQNGPPNFLFHNRLEADGGGYFVDVTRESGIDENNNRFSFAPAWCDFNDDGWPDLYVANDFGRKNLYVNSKGQFRDRAAEAGVEDIGPGMSASWFDSRGNGRADLYVANMWTDAGQRVIADPHFTPAHATERNEAYRRHTMGNSLYRNHGDGTFVETGRAEQANFGRWAWAAGGHDLDNDGEAELFVTCGMLTNQSARDLNSFFWRQVVAKSPVERRPSAAYENGWNAINQFIREDYSWNGHEPNVLHVRRGERYFDFSGVSGLDFADDSRAFAMTDFDGDGRPDILLKSRLGPQLRVLQNDCAEGNTAIAFDLRGVQSNRDAVGARVTVDGRAKWLEAGSGFLSQHSKRLLFGLGQRDTARDVHVKWPSGKEQHFRNLAAGRVYRLLEGREPQPGPPFRRTSRLPAQAVEADNRMQLADTWFAEPVPLPESQTGRRLFVLKELPRERERREHWEIFRRYLFDWRTTLAVPLALLLDDAGHAVKIYARVPTEAQWRADLQQIENAARLAKPFDGVRASETHRDFFKFGVAYLWAGYPEQALPYLQQVLRRNGENPRVQVLVGQIHLEGNRAEEAHAAFESALRVNPRYAEAWSGLGDWCEGRGDLGSALDNYRKALELKPDLLYTLLNAGHAADRLERPADAEDFYRKAAALDAQSAEAQNGLGLALAKQGQGEKAGEFFRQAITLKRDYADAINNLGVLYLQQGKNNDAIAAFEYGIRVAPGEDILYLNLGRMYTHAGNLEKARQVMHELLEHKPGSTVAQHALEELDRH